ncbi:MAG: tol-pal system protein YbgF [Calditrichia bacterium]
MRTKWIKAGCIILLIAFFTGCATRKEVVQFQTDMMYLKNQVEAIRSENEQLRKMLLEINGSISALEEENNRTKADLLTEISSLKQQSQFIDNKLQDNMQQLSKIMQKSERPTPAMLAGDSLTANPAGDSLRLNAPTMEIDARELYNNAYIDLTKGKYELSLLGFREYLKKFPDSELADNAQYWIAETFYAQGIYHVAFDEFKLVTTNYPGGTKVPAALLKMGYCSLKMGEKVKARNYFNQVVQQFPNSEESKLAKSQLEALQ